MQNPHLPIELCELVIDFTLDLGTWWEYRHPGRNTDFMKYTSICSALLPCGRRVLYHTVTFGDPSQVHLFTRSIVENPSLADMVRELVLWPTVEGTYIPFVHATLVKRLRHLKGLVYNLGRTEAHVYPPLHHLLVASLSITELVIRLPDGVPSRKTWFEAFRLIWSLRHLRSLHLTGQEHPDVSRLDVQRLNAIRRPWACSELKTLALQGDDIYYRDLPEHAFGTSIRQLSLHFTGNGINQCTALLTQVSQLLSLEELYLRVTAHIPQLDPSRENSAMLGYFMLILEHLAPQDTLRIIAFHVEDVKDCRRGDFLGDLFNYNVDGIVDKFSQLESLYFRLPERPGSGYDAEDWERMLHAHMPALRLVAATISVRIDWDDTAWVPLGLEDDHIDDAYVPGLGSHPNMIDWSDYYQASPDDSESYECDSSESER